jgi:hypothetical protein
MALAVTRANADDLRIVDQQVDRMIRGRDLQIRYVTQERLVPGRQHQRLDLKRPALLCEPDFDVALGRPAVVVHDANQVHARCIGPPR